MTKKQTENKTNKTSGQTQAGNQLASCTKQAL